MREQATKIWFDLLVSNMNIKVIVQEALISTTVEKAVGLSPITGQSLSYIGGKTVFISVITKE